MRVNLPVVEAEYVITAGESLVSSTDLQGRILHCNQAFIDASGFTREELLGQPHNLVRHPDMPPAAFEDLWRTIAAGSPWTGLVKNRRKDGRCYWVRANVTPLVEQGKPVGYLSVRTAPSRAEVEAATRLYAQMRDANSPAARRISLDAGHVVDKRFAARLGRAIRRNTSLQVGLGAALLAAAGWVGHAVGSPAVGIAIPAVSVVLAMWAGRRHREAPLQALLPSVNAMAAGDLAHDESRPAKLRGAIGRALAQLNVNLRAIVGDARREIDQMRAATREIVAGNADLSARTESQAANVEQTAATMEQITGTVRQSVDAARRAAELAAVANEHTRRSNEAVLEMSQTMRDIANSSLRIGEIIQVIEGVAFQTNLLALNAAVEAARAGEQGRGFAVVAAEVRALARRTTDAAREVTALIQRSQQTVEAGNRVSSAASDKIAEAARSVDEVHAVIGEISAGAHEQLTGISQVNEAVSQLDSLTQANAALVEQIAEAAVALQRQADNVAGAVGVFHLDGGPVSRPDAVALRREMKREQEAALAA
jgi:aerotaxis receptor